MHPSEGGNADHHRDVLNALEQDLGTAELTAVLAEWVSASVHRVYATGAVIQCWRAQLIEQGWAPSTVEASLPMILDRIWPVGAKPTAAAVDQLFIFDEEDDDE